METLTVKLNSIDIELLKNKYYSLQQQTGLVRLTKKTSLDKFLLKLIGYEETLEIKSGILLMTARTAIRYKLHGSERYLNKDFSKHKFWVINSNDGSSPIPFSPRENKIKPFELKLRNDYWIADQKKIEECFSFFLKNIGNVNQC